MSKGWTRRPSAVDRKDYDASWERTFGAKGGLEGLLDSVDSTPLDGLDGQSPEPTFGMHPCDVADTMTPYFKDQRSRA